MSPNPSPILNLSQVHQLRVLLPRAEAGGAFFQREAGSGRFDKEVDSRGAPQGGGSGGGGGEWGGGGSWRLLFASGTAEVRAKAKAAQTT